MLSDLLLDYIGKLIWTDERLGRYGETLIARKLMLSNLLGQKGRILKNIYLPKDDGETSEIDLLYITQKGIIVIESKNYSGWIFGNEKDQYWTQSLSNHSRNRFYNPIRQNQTHIKWLRLFLKNQIPMFSFIVFSERCTLKSVTVHSENVTVLNRDMLRGALKNIYKTSPDVLTKDEISEIYDSLEPLTNVDEAVKQAHIEAIRKKTSQETAQSAHVITARTEPPSGCAIMEMPPYCPQCGAPLVLRTAKKGVNAGQQFYGCSTFPKCRYTMNLPQQS